MLNRANIVTALAVVSLVLLPSAKALACHCPPVCASCAPTEETPPARGDMDPCLHVSSSCCGDPKHLWEAAPSACSMYLMDATVCLCPPGVLFMVHPSRDAGHSGTAGGHDSLALSKGSPVVLDSDLPAALQARLFSKNTICPHLMYCIFLC